MFSKLHQQFGSAGLVLSVVAIVLALAGGAYAAGGGLSSKAKKEVTAIAKKYAGKPGTNGLTGATGLAGTNGTNGTNGTAGTNGVNGKTVLSGSGTPQEAEGEPGDFYIKTGSSPQIFGPKGAGGWGSGTSLKGTAGTPGENGNGVLNGAAAPSNAEGVNGDFYIDTHTDEIFGPKQNEEWPTPGTSLKGETGFTATLPKGQTETGDYVITDDAEARAEESAVFTTISFPIPIPAPLHNNVSEKHVFFIPAGEADTLDAEQCPGTEEAPKAKEGDLCIYGTGSSYNEESLPFEKASPPSDFVAFGADTSGTILSFIAKPEEASVHNCGVWAVTAG